jgi:hypothetical protein
VGSSSSSSADFSAADPYAEAWERLEEAILGTPGALPADVRRAIAVGGAPQELASLAGKVRARAYEIADDDVAGLDDDVVLETVLAAALGASDELRLAGLKELA